MHPRRAALLPATFRQSRGHAGLHDRAQEAAERNLQGGIPMSNIRLRFVTCRDPISEGIRLRENFWASHVEAVTPLGAGPQKYLGAHCDGGVQARDVGYDAKVLQQELFVDLPETA